MITLTNQQTNQERIFIYEHESGERKASEIWKYKIETMRKIKLLPNYFFLMTISHPTVHHRLRPWDFTDEHKIKIDGLVHKFIDKCKEERLDNRFVIRPFYKYSQIKDLGLINL